METLKNTKNDTPSPLNDWLTPKGLEAGYDISISNQNKMRKAGTLPYSKLGNYVRYFRPDIDKMLHAAKVV